MGTGYVPLPPIEVLQQIETPDNQIYFSAVSIWEVAIKTSLGRINFQYSAERIAQAALESGFIELPVTSKQPAWVSGFTTCLYTTAILLIDC
jgi:PIN domain nuclease of toxin-antitoxin system